MTKESPVPIELYDEVPEIISSTVSRGTLDK
jgi:hypothetical protein